MTKSKSSELKKTKIKTSIKGEDKITRMTRPIKSERKMIRIKSESIFNFITITIF